jgi:hypothetical protein
VAEVARDHRASRALERPVRRRGDHVQRQVVANGLLARILVLGPRLGGHRPAHVGLGDDPRVAGVDVDHSERRDTAVTHHPRRLFEGLVGRDRDDRAAVKGIRDRHAPELERELHRNEGWTSKRVKSSKSSRKSRSCPPRLRFAAFSRQKTPKDPMREACLPSAC